LFKKVKLGASVSHFRTRKHLEILSPIEEDSFRIQMDARGAKEDLMNRCCIMPNEDKYPLPSRVEQLKGKKRNSSQAGQKYEGTNYAKVFFIDRWSNYC
jgi:hypothetical protein